MTDNPPDVSTFMRDSAYTFPVLLDTDGSISKSWKVDYAPATFFIDADGIIRKSTIGTFDSAKQIADILNSM